MSKILSIELEWKYSPEDYLEEPISFAFEGGTLEVQKGRALAIIEPKTYQADDTLHDELTRKIENRLHAVQLLTHKKFNLSKASRTDIREDGTKHHYLEVDSIVLMVSMGSPDLVVKDKDGNIVSDSKRERLDKQEWYASLVDKHRSLDLTLNQMLDSYQASVSDPDDELVHLYEIRDSLSNKFGSKKSAIKNLGITTHQWDEIGDLANCRPLKQGRHRGKSAGSLRDAEASELEQGRRSVVYLVEKYLEFLDKNQSH